MTILLMFVHVLACFFLIAVVLLQSGKGAEMGISTQKLHARGPMSVQHLTTTKYVILGSGQIRK